MRIIFLKDHIVDDDLGITVKAGRKGTLIDEATGRVELDEIVVMNGKIPINKSSGGVTFCFEDNDADTKSIGEMGEIIYGTIEGVQPSFYISLRKDL